MSKMEKEYLRQKYVSFINMNSRRIDFDDEASMSERFSDDTSSFNTMLIASCVENAGQYNDIELYVYLCYDLRYE